jgi:pimeloyl-ACP methyl ester carboxylesterase
MVHGRGADAGDMLSLVEILAQPDLAYLVPEAVSRSWYPHSFLAPIMRNEPFLSSALAMLDRLLGRLGTEGLPPERVVLLGFSQGACLALEYAARHARRYGGIIGLSGGLIGPEGTPRDYAGQLAGTPHFPWLQRRRPAYPTRAGARDRPRARGARRRGCGTHLSRDEPRDQRGRNQTGQGSARRVCRTDRIGRAKPAQDATGDPPQPRLKRRRRSASLYGSHGR